MHEQKNHLILSVKDSNTIQMATKFSICLWNKDANGMSDYYQQIFNDFKLISEKKKLTPIGTTSAKKGRQGNAAGSKTNTENCSKATYAFKQMSKFGIAKLEEAVSV